MINVRVLQQVNSAFVCHSISTGTSNAHTHSPTHTLADTTHQAQGSRVPPMWGMEMRFRMRMTENLSHTDDNDAFHLGIRSRQFYIYGFRGVCPVFVCVSVCAVDLIRSVGVRPRSTRLLELELPSKLCQAHCLLLGSPAMLISTN